MGEGRHPAFWMPAACAATRLVQGVGADCRSFGWELGVPAPRVLNRPKNTAACFGTAAPRKRVTIQPMQGNPKVIAELNSALKEELTAISQYFLHAEMCENWKYNKLGDFIKKQSIDEMKHAEALIERILFLDAIPNLTELMQLSVGQNVREQLQSDLKLEIGAVAQYNAAIKVATAAGDNASRALFERLLKDEESHVDWLEAQLHQIKEIGYERYLSQQIREQK
jgi:bacterioferritin